MKHAAALIRPLVVALLLCCPLSGCALIVIGGAAGGTAAYISGELNATLEGSLTDCLAATDRAISTTGIRRISRTVDNLGASYLLRSAMDEKITIDLETISAGTTAIAIRVGLFGDESISRLILEEIRGQLPPR